jgi:hypothetical protein
MIEIVKGWVDPTTGVTNERVYTVAGNAQSTADVNISTCQRSGPGADQLCTVWTDPDFDKTRPSFYYARVIENPSCNSHAYDCKAIAPNQRPADCTDGSIPLTVRDRAWTSPIWYTP